jgi:hypothetical protein
MRLLEASPAATATPTTNRGVYPQPDGWSASAFDYARMSILGPPSEQVLLALEEGLAAVGRPVTREVGAAVKHYSNHVALTDRVGRVLSDVFWGGQNVRPNVEAKGQYAALVVPIIRATGWHHRPSRVDVKRDATAPGLFRTLHDLALSYKSERGLTLGSWLNHDPDKGDTLYLGGRTSQVMLRIYQPALKRAQEEGRTGDDITADERDAVRVELEFKPHKQAAKLAAATLSPDQLWGVSTWSADFAGEVFAMNVQPINISERRESDRNRALRFMASQYRAHLQSLFLDCQGDVSLFGSTILDLADVPHTN